MASPYAYKDLIFPLAGLNRKYAIQAQPPYSTPDAVNVRPETLAHRRCRGGSRPGVGKYIDDRLNGKVNLLGYIKGARYEFTKGAQTEMVEDAGFEGVNDSIKESFFDDFTGSSISTAKWEAFDGMPAPFVDANPPDEQYAEECGAVRNVFTYETDKPYTVSMNIAQVPLHNNSGEYTLYAGLDDSTPADGQGIKAQVIIGGEDEDTQIKCYLGSSLQFVGTSTMTYGLLSIRVNGVKATVSFNDDVIGVIDNVGTLDGTRFGFTLKCTSVETGGVTPIDSFSIDYYVSLDAYPPEGDGNERGAVILNRYAEILVAGANGQIFAETPQGYLTLMNEGSIQTEQKKYPVQTAARLTDLFVADYRSSVKAGGENLHKAHGFDGAITSGGVLSATAISDWTELGITADSDVVTISDGSSGVANGTYVISAVASGGITLTGYSGAAGDCAFDVDVSPKVFNSNAGTYVPWVAEEGAVPTNCPLICLYRDRLVLAGAEDNPHLWYMSRQGNPYDWDYAEDLSDENLDYGIAVAGQNSNAGVIGKPIRALIPHSDDYLVFGYDDEMWVLRGDPAANGQIDCVSREVGIVGGRAWCYGERGEIYFLSRKGVYAMQGGYSVPQQISREKLPDELMNLNWRDDNVQMVYDHDWHGCHIFIEGAEYQWFLDLENGGLWKMQYANLIDICTATALDGKTLMGGIDGFIYMYDNDRMADEGYPFTSKVLIGPFRPATSDYKNSVVQKLCCTFDGSIKAKGVTLTFYVGDEAEEAWYNYLEGKAVCSLTLAKDISTQLRRFRGAVVIVEVMQSGLAQWWGMERIGVYAKVGGRFKE